ncbi:Gfo/Idh/MocA family protein [Shouchella shacheensis]|uniref:Gfo/Idh/MocA family protein n=1 Tax=Shouchella shacheensis TaxID=1649580 RepID=UPI00073FE2A0|nr:Gfo/Idh/MocA family oxidoreductase [Shouchella shacheensis]
MVRVLVVGLGTMGSTHAASFAAMENVQLMGVVDKNAKLVNTLAKKLDTKGFASFEEAASYLEGQIDVVSVCLPTNQHATYVKKAADIGADVICEKPLARQLGEAREMMDYCKKKGSKLFVGHVVRFFPEYVKAKAVMEEGKVGEVAVARTMRGGPFPRASENWYANYDSSGGLILDMIIHDFDFLRWTFGDVERVYAKNLAGTTGENEAMKDYALVTLRFKSGVIAHVEGSWAHKQFHTSFEFAGKDGVISYSSAKEKPVVTERIAEEGEASGGVSVPESPLAQSPYDRELHHFMDCIQTGKEPVVTAEDAYKAMEIALAALQSIEEKRPVSLEAQTIQP